MLGSVCGVSLHSVSRYAVTDVKGSVTELRLASEFRILNAHAPPSAAWFSTPMMFPQVNKTPWFTERQATRSVASKVYQGY
jgi:hypothetical protein